MAAEARALARAGHAVTVIAPGRGSPHADMDVAWVRDGDAFGWPGALNRLKARPWRALGMGRFVVGARRALDSRGPFDRVIAHWMVPCAWPVASDVRAPLEVVAHGSDVRLLLSAPAPLRKRLMSNLLDRDTRFRFVSHELRDALLRGSDTRLHERSRIELPTLDVANAPSRARARSALNVADDSLLSVVVARLVPEKRVDVALSALQLVPAVRVVVIGEGPERASLVRRFPEAELVGALSHADTLRWMAAADLVLSASLREGAPTVVREARALGVPVVACVAGDLAAWAATDLELHLVGRPR